MNQEITSATTKEYCYRHPNVEATLHCNRCERPICTECAILTPTGYRCPECVRSQQRTFNTAQWIDYPLGFVIAGGLGYLGSLVASVLGFFTIFIAPIAGMIIAEAVRAVIRKRRSKRLFQVVTLGAVLGSLPLLLRELLVMILTTRGGNPAAGAVFSLLPLVWQGVYTVMIASTVYYRLSGIQMRV